MNSDLVRFEAYATHIRNYANMTTAAVGSTGYLTYAAIDALMAGANIRLTADFLEISAGYIWAENSGTNTPLSEIPPLKLSTMLVSPPLYEVTGFIRHTYTDAQTRVDATLSERPTPACNTIDVGLTYSFGVVQFTLEANNVTNAVYYQHLSYQRDPFASGAVVFEPGRTLRASLRFGEIL